jgi:carboxymethylenebutenolidase
MGYAAAAMPLMAQTAIKTSTEGLNAGEISFEVDGFNVPAYFAAPVSRTNLPVVLVVHEIFGVHEYIADVCRRFAKAGYIAVAPDLFARQGDPGQYGEVAKIMSQLVAKVPDQQVLADLDGARIWASDHGGALGKVGVTGFCWGGRIAWLYAAHAPIKAAVAWYGHLTGPTNALKPKNPIDVAATLKAPVLGLYAGQDTGIALDDVEKMRVALSKGGAASKASEFVLYQNAPHAFHADYRPSYRADTALDGWERCLKWFENNGVA